MNKIHLKHYLQAKAKKFKEKEIRTFLTSIVISWVKFDNLGFPLLFNKDDVRAEID